MNTVFNMTSKAPSISRERSIVKVAHVMHTPVLTVTEDEKVNTVAKLMVDNDVGSVVVANPEGKPVGIITERDIVSRVTLKEAQPSKVRSKEIMSHPIAFISSDASLDDAAERMRRLRVKRLLVMDKNKIVGIVTRAEIFQIKPAIEAVVEKSKPGIVIPKGENLPLAGYCEACGLWSETLVENDGKFICEDCAADLTEEPGD